ncbi:hypothetical protein ACA910_020117 [Epithemia clementina (nom. ined.)]
MLSARNRKKGVVPLRIALRIVIATLGATVVATLTFVFFFLDHISHSQYGQSNPIKEAMLSSSRRVEEQSKFQSMMEMSGAAKMELEEKGSNVSMPENRAVEYPVENPIPNPPAADGNQTFSACLLVMDDNHRLVEWLAYHYHVLPLRYMIVAVDPRSKTSPTYLFNRWRKKGMVIIEWSDKDFWKRRKTKTTTMSEFDLKPIPEDADFQIKRDRHRGRQKYFYRSCMSALKEANRTWVTLHDTDEFLVYNHAGGDSFEAWEDKMQERHARSDHASEIRVRPAHTPPTTAEPGAMIQYIRQEQAAGLAYYQSPCIGIPRLQFGAEESATLERSKNVPFGFDPTVLDTLRWRKHALRNDFVKNALGKVMMDVSRINIAKAPYFQSLHRPIKTICSAPWHNEWNSGFRINHYLGSWESYSFRTHDARKGGERSWEQWEYKAYTNGDQTDDNIRPWLSGFVHAHGSDEARKMLDGAGLPESGSIHGGNNASNHSDTTEWSLLPEKLEKILSTDRTVTNDNKMVKFDEWVRQKYNRLRSTA